MIKNSKHTESAKLKNRLAHLGKRVGEQNKKWKGNNVGYGALHDWLRRHYGNANKCENALCPKISKIYDWANISGEYKRDILDWKQLCRSCHLKMDWKPKDTCRNGHLLSEAGISVDNRGSRICKECKRLNARNDYKKHKERIIKRITERRRFLRSTIKR